MQSRVVLAMLTTGILALPITAFAQEATLTGQVTDATGAVLPGVVVRAIHEATGTTTEVVTDGRGGFRIPTRIGTHQITAELAGFTTVTRTGLSLSVGQEIVVNLQMSPSTVQETVTVTGEAPLVNPTEHEGERRRQHQADRGTAPQRPELAGSDPACPRPDGEPHGHNADRYRQSGRLPHKYRRPAGDDPALQPPESHVQPGCHRRVRVRREPVRRDPGADAWRSVERRLPSRAPTPSRERLPATSGTADSTRADFIQQRVLPYSNQQISGTLGGPIRRNRAHIFGSYEYEREPQILTYDSPYPFFNLDSEEFARTARKFLGRGDLEVTSPDASVGPPRQSGCPEVPAGRRGAAPSVGHQHDGAAYAQHDRQPDTDFRQSRRERAEDRLLQRLGPVGQHAQRPVHRAPVALQHHAQPDHVPEIPGWLSDWGLFPGPDGVFGKHLVGPGSVHLHLPIGPGLSHAEDGRGAPLGVGQPGQPVACAPASWISRGAPFQPIFGSSFRCGTISRHGRGTRQNWPGSPDSSSGSPEAWVLPIGGRIWLSGCRTTGRSRRG